MRFSEGVQTHLSFLVAFAPDSHVENESKSLDLLHPILFMFNYQDGGIIIREVWTGRLNSAVFLL